MTFTSDRSVHSHVSIVMPVFNEMRAIDKMLRRVQAVDIRPRAFRGVVSADGLSRMDAAKRRVCVNDQKTAGPPDLTVVVPVYSRARDGDAGIESCHRGSSVKEIIIVDNCSIDGTCELLMTLNGAASVVFQPRNLGKANSVRAAIPQARGEYFIIQDSAGVDVDDELA